MNRIDIHNYEAYLLDFSEGNLHAEQQVELELFLIQHPELDIDLADLSPVSIEKSIVHYTEKNKLKRSESDLISEAQFIACIEHQLPLKERLHIEKTCEINPSLLKELNLYKASIATPDSSIVYSEKAALKRKPKLVWFDFSYIHYAAAACILFLIGLFILWPGNDNGNQKEQLANQSGIKSELKTKMNSPSQIQSPLAIKTSTHKASFSKKPKPFTNKQVLSHQKENKIVKETIEDEKTVPAPIPELKTNEPLIASTMSPVVNTTKTIVQVITENEEDMPEVNKETKKKGLWAVASRALKNLNHAGVKSVNGDESSDHEKTDYALTLGGLKITHKPANL